MSQEEILEIIKRNPGLSQKEILKLYGTCKSSVNRKLIRLAKREDIRRELDKTKKIWKYYVKE